jgi:hypothetical protein
VNGEVSGRVLFRARWSSSHWRCPGALRRPAARYEARFDALGALLVVWMSALLLAFAIPAGFLGPFGPLALGALGMIGLAAFLVREARHPEPIIRPSLFRDADFAVLNAASIAVNFAAFSVLLLVPYYLVRIVAETGLGGRCWR